MSNGSSKDNADEGAHRWSTAFLFAGLVLTLLILVPAGLAVGPADLGMTEILRSLGGQATETEDLILWNIRLPRMILAFFVGAALAQAGVVFQGLLTNPLAGPYTLGVSSGAAFGASIAILIGLSMWLLPFLALAGAGITLFLVLLISGARKGLDPRSMILAGIVVGSIFSAAISFIKSVSGESLTTIVFWILGSLSGRGWSELAIFLPYFGIGVVGLLVLVRELDLLCLGPDHAHAAGVDVENTRKLLVFFASLLAAAAVAVSGVIGFVGLVVPHGLRMIVGPGHRRLALLSILAGGALLMGADILARAMSFAGQIPVGVITSLLGGPFFCILLIKHRRAPSLA